MKSTKDKKIKINLGSGKKYLEGYLNCDFSKNVKKDKFIDLNKFPYPFKNNYADEIMMDNVLEHLDNLVNVMEELHRILKNKGRLIITVPYGKSDGAMQDPTHKHFFTERTMDYFTNDSELKFYSNARFKKIQVKLYTHDYSVLHKMRSLLPFRKWFKFLLFNMYDTIDFKLEAIK